MTAPVVLREHSGRRPGELQRQRVKEILRGCPALVAGGPLTLVYIPARAAETAWLCAHARAAGLVVSLAAVADTTLAVQRKLHTEAASGATVIVLADMAVELPPGAIQLPGTETLSPIDLWQSPAALAARAETVLAQLPNPLVAAGVTVTTGPWVVRGATLEADVRQAEGIFVADGAITVNRSVHWDARLANRPVTITIHDGRVTAVHCDDPMLYRFLDRAVHTHLTGRVAAVRIGLHPHACGFTAATGPLNAGHPGLSLRLRSDADRVYSTASADLCVDLTATYDPVTQHSPTSPPAAACAYGSAGTPDPAAPADLATPRSESEPRVSAGGEPAAMAPAGLAAASPGPAAGRDPVAKDGADLEGEPR